MRNNRRIFLFLLSIPLLVSLACDTTALNRLLGSSDRTDALPLPVASAPENQPPNEVDPVDQPIENSNSGDQQNPAGGFLKSDCSMSGIVFDPISIGSYVDDVYDGPSLSCSYSTINGYGLAETVYFSIVAYKPDKLEEFYQDSKENISGYIAQANEWNAHPDLSPDMKNGISMIRDDNDGYVFLITKNANVQGCTKGDGYGVEKVNGKYLIKILFSSCVSDASSYLVSVKYLQAAAEAAVSRIEAGAQP